ncbi:hypothetical protein [Hymenobacter sp. BT730]|uniref:hypothetical protein n=1 Tax=Hymenobacter sp. BT730 TaxID=3063332 RepID=UPI0026E00F0A|nr:hypothetical protein [Hymenobacter sp. BT730]
MNSKQLLLCLAAGLMLASCSAEPSDWRPEKKVSLDMVAPGTRTSQYFDQHTAEAPSQHKGAAIEEPISSGVDLERAGKAPAEHSISTNAEKVERTKNEEDAPKPAKASDSPIGE